ncbi:MAG: class III poly(R)-hydroxyalkanoic acid synthase subunit PhaC [Cytophagales bacterium]|nr:MAG: class III poly(R)-hydroxyalkanoic acid synthase subunit PhaC [Cytophagales bacterium]
MENNTLLQNIKQRINKYIQTFYTWQELHEAEVGETPRKTVWQRDKVRLMHYLSPQTTTYRTPLLVSYALINRYHMMDLQSDRSLVKKLQQYGADIYVLDTGYPNHTDRYLTMNDYVNGYLGGAIDFLRKQYQLEKINLLGICQGGTYAVMYAALHPQKIKNLITMVTPIDFDNEEGIIFKWLKYIDADILVDGMRGVIPGYVADVGFQMAKPMLKFRKARTLLEIMDNKEAMLNYLRMEKWNNDQPSLAGEAAKEFIKAMFQQNLLIKGGLEIAQKPVNLSAIDMPILTIYAAEDHLVPPATTKPLNDLVSSADKTLYEFPGGHVGVFTGRRSQAELAPTIAQWLKERDH